jgi:hypothetical protein
LKVLGTHCRPLERIPTAGSLVGVTRSTAYRLSAGWPLVGPDSSRWVLMVPFFQQHGIPYEVEQGSPEDESAD